jgi:hypothetical protein
MQSLLVFASGPSTLGTGSLPSNTLKQLKKWTEKRVPKQQTKRKILSLE